jgi:tetratricopeptide (TPR) repeat protein
MGKPLKDVDIAKRALILTSFMKVFPLLAILGLVLWGVLGILVALLVSIVAAMLSETLSGFIGGSANVLYGVGRRTMTLRDQLSGTMSIARNHKMNKRFDEAFLSVEEVIAEDPEYPDALFLKAQILWEGFEDADEAKECLEKIMELANDENDPIFRWASTLYDELITSKNLYRN